VKYIAHDLGDLDSAYIIPFSDLHLGDPLFDEDKFIGYRDWVLEEPNRYCTINGDIMNAAIPGSVSNASREKYNVEGQFERIKEIFAPLFEQGRVLCWNDGNHEERIDRVTGGLRIGSIICSHFHRPELYTGEGALVVAKLGKGKNGKRIAYTLYVTHGSAGGKRAGGKANAVEDLQRIVLADVYVEGHNHLSLAFPRAFFEPDLHNGNIIKRKQVFLCGGSFLGWGGYSERKSYPPTWSGCPRVFLSGRRKDIHCSV